jgi:hypothetical protein
MNEEEYIDSIDACFPYDKWKETIDQGISISANAAYWALYELFDFSPYSKVTREQLSEMIDYWSSRFSHPIKEIVLEAFRTGFDNRKLETQKVLDYLNIVSKYKGLFGALLVIRDSGDYSDKRIDQKCDDIVKLWLSKNHK